MRKRALKCKRLQVYRDILIGIWKRKCSQNKGYYFFSTFEDKYEEVFDFLIKFFKARQKYIPTL